MENKTWCVLCRKDGITDANKGRTTKYICSPCIIPIFVSVTSVLHRICWFVWHTVQIIVPRHVGAAERRSPSQQLSSLHTTPGAGSVSRIINRSRFTARQSTETPVSAIDVCANRESAIDLSPTTSGPHTSLPDHLHRNDQRAGTT